MSNDAIIIQHCYSNSEYANMLRLSYSRHCQYALMHKFDYWALVGNVYQPPIEDHPGAWEKIYWVRQAFSYGYQFVAWLDADSLIVDMKADLRDALKGGVQIGACQHPGPPVHLNVGVMYFANTQAVNDFITEWLNHMNDPVRGWAEQGWFNELSQGEKHKGVVGRIDDIWNATYHAGTNRPNSVVLGFHGPAAIGPLARFQAMQSALASVT
jgi:hypothetical protein